VLKGAEVWQEQRWCRAGAGADADEVRVSSAKQTTRGQSVSIGSFFLPIFSYFEEVVASLGPQGGVGTNFVPTPACRVGHRNLAYPGCLPPNYSLPAMCCSFKPVQTTEMTMWRQCSRAFSSWGGQPEIGEIENSAYGRCCPRRTTDSSLLGK